MGQLKIKPLLLFGNVGNDCRSFQAVYRPPVQFKKKFDVMLG